MNYLGDNPAENSSRSFAEWVSFSISLLILSLIVTLVIYQWVTKKDQPPILLVTTDGNVRQEGGQFYIPFTVVNNGSETAESVEVMAELEVNGETEEIGSQQIDFLSGGETDSGAFILDRNPNSGKLIVKVTGYKLP
jgi:uncharacterized protein (TIGR02588 family)